MDGLFAGRFELVAPLAEGGMGSVWVVRDHRDGQAYAGKLLRQVDSGSLLRFMREQATRISHEHVVTPLSWAGEDDRVLFTMPLVRGGSVATLVGDHGPLPETWVVGLLDQLLQALEAVHASGVVHRDVKPANLLLHATGVGAPHLLLTDFGIAAHVRDPRLTSASQVVGTPGYLAPEQLDGADPHPTQDVYAAGMVGLEMLTGVRPSRSPGATAPATGALADLLVRATSRDPRDRPPSAAAFRAELAALGLEPPAGDPQGVMVLDQVGHLGVAPSSTTVRSGSSPARASSGADPRRLVGVLLLVVAVACLAAAGWLLVA